MAAATIEDREENYDTQEYYDAEEGSPQDYFAEPADYWEEQEEGFCGMIQNNSQGAPDLFDEQLPPKDPPFAMPELSEGLQKRFKKGTLEEVEGGIPIFAKENYTIPARSQMTLPVRWGAKPPRNSMMVIHHAEGNQFSNQLMGGSCVVNSFSEHPLYVVTNLRNKPVVLPTVLP